MSINALMLESCNFNRKSAQYLLVVLASGLRQDKQARTNRCSRVLIVRASQSASM